MDWRSNLHIDRNRASRAGNPLDLESEQEAARKNLVANHANRARGTAATVEACKRSLELTLNRRK